MDLSRIVYHLSYVYRTHVAGALYRKSDPQEMEKGEIGEDYNSLGATSGAVKSQGKLGQYETDEIEP